MSEEKITPLGPFYKPQGDDVMRQEEIEKGFEEFKGQMKSYIEGEGAKMTERLRTGEQPKPLTRQEQIEQTPEGEIPKRLSPSSPTPTDTLALPTTLPKHGVRSLYTEEERILERASLITKLPPESPFTHTIAQRLAKGDPFSAQSLEDAQEETMKLARAGLIPNPNYEGWSGKVVQAYEFIAPVAVEMGIPLAVGIATSPLLLAPEPLTKALWIGIQGATGTTSSLLAQSMRIGYGQQQETSFTEAFAAGGFSLIPGVKTGKDLSKAATIFTRSMEGAVMAGGENLTHQGLDILYGNKDTVNLGETAAAAGVGSVIGAGLGRLENALVKYSAKDKGSAVLLKALKDELKLNKKALKEKEKASGGVEVGLRHRINKIEENINALQAPEETHVAKAIEQLEKAEAEQLKVVEDFAKDFEQSSAATVLRTSDQTTGDAPKAPEVPEDIQRIKSIANKARNAAKDLRRAQRQGTPDEVETTSKVLDDLKIELNGAINDSKSLEGIKKEDAADFVDKVNNFVNQKQGNKDAPAGGFSEDFPQFGDAPKAPEPTVEQPEVDEGKGREALDNFLEGEGGRDVDPETGRIDDTDDEIKARLLTSSEEKQRLVNSIQDAIKDDLKNIKGGRRGKLEYIAKVQDELNRRLGKSDDIGMVMNAAQLSDNLEVADSIEKLAVHMSANGVVLVKNLTDLQKSLEGADISDPEVLNDSTAAIFKIIPQMLGWKKTGTEIARALQSRKYVKDELEVTMQRVEDELETNLVSDLKAAKDLTPEQMAKQVETFGDIEGVKRLLKAIQQAEDIGEIRQILVEQQQAFQKSTSRGTTVKQDAESTSAYVKVRDVAVDFQYSSMLSAPTTPMKALIGNAVMSPYHSLMGKIGAKYMSLAPWARNGLSKQEYEKAYAFWKATGSSYGDFTDISMQEARRAFKNGIDDLTTHFERVGGSALSMERTGLEGALGQSVENLGQFIDVPGKAMAAIDARTRMRVAHSMTKSKAKVEWMEAGYEGRERTDTFEEHYDNFLKKVFSEDGTKLMNEDQVRRQAVLNAQKEGVKAEDLSNYIDSYVKNNWDTSTSQFVDYVKRNAKEISFTEELGEFNDINLAEKATKGFEDVLKLSPIATVLLNPFMRTGRNIIRETLSQSSMLASIPGASKITDKIWVKTMQDLNSGDPIIAARAKGRQIIGAGFIATIYGLVENDGDFTYVGNQNQNWKKKENLNVATGLGDYELRIPTPQGVVGIDMSSVEPFASVANIVADCVTLSKGTPDQQQSAAEGLHLLALVVSNNIGNKSYFKNLGDSIKLITLQGESEEATNAQRWRLAKGMASRAVPSIMNAAAMSTDSVRRRADNLLQVLGKRIGGIAREVAPYRDAFGDAIDSHPHFKGIKGQPSTTSQALSRLIPFRINKQRMNPNDYIKTDENGLRSIDVTKVNLKNADEVRNAAWAVLTELNGEYHFNNGTTKLNGIDLQELIHNETQENAFERWQQIYSKIKLGGRDVKQAVVYEARQSYFKKQTNVPEALNTSNTKLKDERLEEINSILTDYRDEAYEKLKKEFPVLKYEERLQENRQDLYEDGKTLKALTGDTPVELYQRTSPDKGGQPKSKLEQLMIPFNN